MANRIDRCAETFPKLFERPPVTNEGKDPEFMKVMQRYIFGDIWHAGPLDERMRGLCEIAAMTARHTLPALKNHIRSAFNAGCTALEIREAVYQCAPFTGFPHVMEALVVMNEVFEEKGLEIPLHSDEEMIPEEDRLSVGEERMASMTAEDLTDRFRDLPAPYDEMLPYMLSAYGFGDFTGRGILSTKERSLLILIILTASDTPGLLKPFADGYLKNGGTSEEILCALVQASPYMGLARLLGALEEIRDLLIV